MKPEPAKPTPKAVNPRVKKDYLASHQRNVQDLVKQKMQVYIKKERQEVLAFYLRPDVATVMDEYEKQLGEFYDKVVGSNNEFERDTKRMSQEGYVRGFGQSSELMPMVLTRRDMELIFDTIVNERVDQGGDDDNALASVSVTLSFEEFKKSTVRVASLCTVTSERFRMAPGEVADD